MNLIREFYFIFTIIGISASTYSSSTGIQKLLNQTKHTYFQRTQPYRWLTTKEYSPKSTLPKTTYTWNSSHVPAIIYQQSYCPERCQDDQLVSLHNIYQEGVHHFFCSMCFCNSSCKIYGLCCPDISSSYILPAGLHSDIFNTSNNYKKQFVYSKAENEFNTSTKAAKRYTPKLGCSDPNYTDYDFAYIKSCHPEFKGDRRVVEMCEENMSDNKTTLDYLTYVVDTEHEVMYRNKFCAECNMVISLDSLNVNVTCTNYMNIYTVSTETDLIRFALRPGSGCRLMQYFNYAVRTVQCDLEQQTVKSNCDIDRPELDTAISAACDDIDGPMVFSLDVYDAPVYYKNLFCAICNLNTNPAYGGISNVTKTGAGRRVHLQPPALSLLITLNRPGLFLYWQDESQVFTLAGHCSVTEWSAPNGECLPLKCSAGKVQVNSTCVSALADVTGLRYQLKAWLVPRHKHLSGLAESYLLNGIKTKLESILQLFCSEYDITITYFTANYTHRIKSTIFLMTGYFVGSIENERNNFENSILKMFLKDQFVADNESLGFDLYNMYSGLNLALVEENVDQIKEFVLQFSQKVENNETANPNSSKFDPGFDEMILNFSGVIPWILLNQSMGNKIEKLHDTLIHNETQGNIPLKWPKDQHNQNNNRREYGENNLGNNSIFLISNGNLSNTFNPNNIENTTPFAKLYNRLIDSAEPSLLVSHLLVCRYLSFNKTSYNVNLDYNVIPPKVSINIYLTSISIQISEQSDLNNLDIDQDGFLQVCHQLLDTKLQELDGRLRQPFNLGDPTGPAEYILTMTCLGVSLLCLTLTLAVYGKFQELRSRAGHNNIILSVTLLLAQSSLIATAHTPLTSPVCTAVGIATHFLWLWMFTWAFISSYQMFKVFTSKTRRASPSARQETLELLKKISLSILFPALLCVTVIVTSLVVSDGQKTGYGESCCYLDSALFSALFVIAPLVVIIVSNLTFFLVTVASIHRINQLQASRLNPNTPSQMFIYVKLSSLTGIFWAVAFIAELFDVNALRYISIVLNGLQGVFMFVSFVGKRVVLLLLGRNRQDTQPSVTQMSYLNQTTQNNLQ